MPVNFDIKNGRIPRPIYPEPIESKEFEYIPKTRLDKVVWEILQSGKKKVQQSTYNPSQTGYQPTYNPSQTGYQPTYNPSQTGYQPTYNPSQTGYQPTYNPSQTGYQPTI
jgi:hypothetical protein